MGMQQGIPQMGVLAGGQLVFHQLQRGAFAQFDEMAQVPCGIAVLRPREHQGLLELRERIGALLPRAGLFTPKSFTPHVTLARDAHFAEPPKHEICIRWSVREFVLVWSRLPPEVKPAQYEVLERFGVNDLAWSPGGEPGEQFPLFGGGSPQCSRRQKQ